MYKSTMTLIFFVMMVLTPTSQANDVFTGNGIVSYVVDGDTFDIQTTRDNLNFLIENDIVDARHVNLRNSTFRVRLANIDTEESTHRDPSKNTEFGIFTSNHVRELITGKNTEFSCFRKGHWGRAICSIDVEGTGDLGIYLIRNGFSPYLTSFGNHPTMHWQYRRAQGEQILDKHEVMEKFKKATSGKTGMLRNALENFLN